MDVRQIHREDVFRPSLERVWMSMSKVEVIRAKRTVYSHHPRSHIQIWVRIFKISEKGLSTWHLVNYTLHLLRTEASWDQSFTVLRNTLAVSCKQTSNRFGCQTGLTTGLTTVLNEQPLFVQPVVKPGCTTGLTTGCTHDRAGCQTGCQTGLTTGWMFVYTIQPTGLTTFLTTACIV